MLGFVFKFAYFLLGKGAYLYFLLRKNTHPQTPSAREGAFQGANSARALNGVTAVRKGAFQGANSRNDGLKAFFASFALAFLLLIPNLAKAEQSGWFVGVQAGYGKGERHREREASKTSAGTTTFSDYYFADSTGTRRNVIQEQDASNDSGVASGTYYNFDPTDSQITWKSGRAAERNKIIRAVPTCTGDLCYYGLIYNAATSTYQDTLEMNDELKGLNAGLLAGYKHFFSTKLGLRVYGLLDYSYYKDSDTALQKMQAYNANLNLDVLYNLYDKNERIMGVFAGLSVGGAQYISSNTRLASDIDIGLNFGLRFGAGKHSIELFSRVGGLFVGAEHYSTATDNESYTNLGAVVSHTELTRERISLCPANNGTVTIDCQTASSSTTNGRSTTQPYKYYRTYRFGTQTVYNGAETYDSPIGSAIMDSYKQPYKIGIRYIYSF